jgi:hypothetical protein
MKSFRDYFEAAAMKMLPKKKGRKPKRTTVGIRNIASRYEAPEKDAKRVFKKVYNKALESYGDEGRAIATAYSILHKKFGKPK